MTDEYKALVNVIVAHRLVGMLSLPQANTLFYRMFESERAGLPAPSFRELLGSSR